MVGECAEHGLQGCEQGAEQVNGERPGVSTGHPGLSTAEMERALGRSLSLGGVSMGALPGQVNFL